MILGMMLCLFDVQLLAVGLIGELLMRTHFESRVNPMYRVERLIVGSRPAGDGGGERSFAARLPGGRRIKAWAQHSIQK